MLQRGHTVRIFTGRGHSTAGKLFLGKRANVWGSHGTVRVFNKAGTKVASFRF